MNTSEQHTNVHGAIVVGVDTSPAGRLAAGWAARQAELEGRRLILVRTIGTMGTNGTTYLNSVDRETSPVLNGMYDEAESILAGTVQILRHVHPDLPIETVAVAEDAAPELRRLTQDAHLLVLGSDGHGLAPHGTPWQTGVRVARNAACPVVVVPRHPNTVRRGVLVGVDLSERSSDVLRFAFEMASLRGLPLVAMHVDREGLMLRVQETERVLAEIVSGFREEFPDVPVTLEVTHGWPTGQLIQESGRMHLLVIGQHHRPEAFESPLGHVRSGMVARAECPVAVVPVAAGQAARA